MADLSAHGRWLRGRLSRVTSSGGYIAELDGLRFLAIAAVVVFHIHYRVFGGWNRSLGDHCVDNWIKCFIDSGHYGVELFFIISGFILALPFASHSLTNAPPLRLSKYYLRRLTRLEPPYIVCVLLLFAARVTWLGFQTQVSVGHLMAGVFYLHNLIYNTSNPIDHVTWSLEIEVQFYLLAPFMAKVFAIGSWVRRRLLLVAGALAFIAAQTLFLKDASPWWLTRSIANYLQYFLGGFLLADLYLVSWRDRTASLGWDCVGVLSCMAIALLWLLEVKTATSFLLPLALVLFCSAAFRGIVINWVLRRTWIALIGGMCYSIYLLHVPIQGMLYALAEHVFRIDALALRQASEVVCLSLGTLLISAMYFVLVERPCMLPDWPRRLADTVRGTLRKLLVFSEARSG